jgi:hypothetical protein
METLVSLLQNIKNILLVNGVVILKGVVEGEKTKQK